MALLGLLILFKAPKLLCFRYYDRCLQIQYWAPSRMTQREAGPGSRFPSVELVWRSGWCCHSWREVCPEGRASAEAPGFTSASGWSVFSAPEPQTKFSLTAISQPVRVIWGASILLMKSRSETSITFKAKSAFPILGNVLVPCFQIVTHDPGGASCMQNQLQGKGAPKAAPQRSLGLTQVETEQF